MKYLSKVSFHIYYDNNYKYANKTIGIYSSIISNDVTVIYLPKQISKLYIRLLWHFMQLLQKDEFYLETHSAS